LLSSPKPHAPNSANTGEEQWGVLVVDAVQGVGFSRGGERGGGVRRDRGVLVVDAHGQCPDDARDSLPGSGGQGFGLWG